MAIILSYGLLNKIIIKTYKNRPVMIINFLIVSILLLNKI